VPVVGHDDVREDAHVVCLPHFVEEILEVLIRLIVLKYLHASICTIDDMVDMIIDVNAQRTSHGKTIPRYLLFNGG